MKIQEQETDSENKVEYKKLLNPSQYDAVTTLDGPVLVIAGAGSGKTRTLIYRVARLVEKGIPPESILLLTFTRKAAGEMQERAAELTDERCRFISGGTFHSLAHRVLRSHANLLGYEKNFTIMDRPDMEEAVQSLVSEIKIEKKATRFPKRATLTTIISKSVNLQKGIDELMRDEFSQFLEYIPEISKINVLYSDYKKKNQLMDYDDLLILFRQLLEEHEDVREALGNQYKYIMVDEYQDTNGIQSDIIRWLASLHQNVMVVGDDSQSIYSFRGANYRNMFDFPRIFKETKIIKLEENYRSTQPILSFTNALMAQATEKYTKCLFTKREDGASPKIVDVRTGPEQAMYICRAIKEHHKNGKSLREIAVLFRAAYHSFDLELELTRQKIPFVKYGGFKFIDSAHIKDLLAHLRILTNKNDVISWGRILRLIKGIGQKKSLAIINWIKTEKIKPGHLHKWPKAGKKDKGLEELSMLLKNLSNKKISPETAVKLAYEYYDPILKERFDDYPRRQKELNQLTDMAKRYDKIRPMLDDLVLDPPTSSSDIELNKATDFLTLSTVHSSKGLEWSTVFIMWVMEGYFPSIKSYSSLPALEEERRLMYVASTRAKDDLTICYPGQEELPVWKLADTGYRSGLSSFIQSLPPDVTEHASSSSFGKPSRLNNPWKRNNIAPLGETPKVDSSQLRPGDRVLHPAFGRGVISRVMDKTKIEVLFRDAGKKLLHMEYTTLDKI